MKKMRIMVALCLMVVTAAVAQQENVLDSQTAISDDFKSLQLAYDLADYGYENESASALIVSAEIFAKLRPRDFSQDVQKEGTSAEAADDSQKTYTAEQLLTDAKLIAAGDKTLTKYANEVRQTLKQGGTRGVVGGPRRDRDCAAGDGGSFRYNLTFEGNHKVEVMLRSLDGCNYNVTVYDQGGHLVGSDQTTKSNAYVNWTPAWTGVFSIEVKNNSPKAGRYELVTN